MKPKVAVVAGAGMLAALVSSPSSPAASTYYTGKVTPHLTVATKPSRLTRFPAKITISGAVVLPDGVNVADACSGRVAITIRTSRKKRVATAVTAVKSTCEYRLTLKLKRRLPKQSLSIVASFEGNSALTVAHAKTLVLRVT